MATKTQKMFTDEKGNIIVTLPVKKIEVSLRPPKGKDLRAIEAATKAFDGSNIAVMMYISSLLSVSPIMTLEEVEDLDAEDVTALGEAISTFRAFGKMA